MKIIQKIKVDSVQNKVNNFFGETLHENSWILDIGATNHATFSIK